MIVRWTQPAVHDLADIADYIRADNPAAAERVGLTIRAAVNGLRDHPHLGRPGRVVGTRELVIPRLPYIVGYRVADDTIQILAVRHGARRWPKTLTI